VLARKRGRALAALPDHAGTMGAACRMLLRKGELLAPHLTQQSTVFLPVSHDVLCGHRPISCSGAA